DGIRAFHVTGVQTCALPISGVGDDDHAGFVDAWLSGAFASTKGCITSPDTVDGQVIRAAGPAFEEMLATAGASITSMPSSEIYKIGRASCRDRVEVVQMAAS